MNRHHILQRGPRSGRGGRRLRRGARREHVPRAALLHLVGRGPGHVPRRPRARHGALAQPARARARPRGLRPRRAAGRAAVRRRLRHGDRVLRRGAQERRR